MEEKLYGQPQKFFKLRCLQEELRDLFIKSFEGLELWDSKTGNYEEERVLILIQKHLEENIVYKERVLKGLQDFAKNAYKYAASYYVNEFEGAEVFPETDDVNGFFLSGEQLDRFFILCSGNSKLRIILLGQFGCSAEAEPYILRSLEKLTRILSDNIPRSKEVGVLEIKQLFCNLVMQAEGSKGDKTEANINKGEAIDIGCNLIDQLVNEVIYSKPFSFIDRIGEMAGKQSSRDIY